MKYLQRRVKDLGVSRNFSVKNKAVFEGETSFNVFGDAPVNGAKSTVTVDMTNDNADMVYTAVSYGADGNDITVTHVDPSANSAELSVSVDGSDITVSLATNASGAITSTSALVAEAINTDEEASLLVIASAEGTGAGIVNAKAETSLANGVTVTEGELGTFKIKTDGSVIYYKISSQVWKKASLSAL